MSCADGYKTTMKYDSFKKQDERELPFSQGTLRERYKGD